MIIKKFKVNFHRVIVLIITIFIFVNIGNRGNLHSEFKKITNEQDAIAAIKEDVGDSAYSEIYLYRKELTQKTLILPAYIDTTGEFEIQAPSWLFIVDDNPAANFSHPISIRLIDSRNGTIQKYTYYWWPKIDEKNFQYFVPQSMINHFIIKNSTSRCSSANYVYKGKLYRDSPFPDKFVGSEVISASNKKFLRAIVIGGDFAKKDNYSNPYENNLDRGTEFLGGFIEAFTTADADKDKNNMISLGEAFEYAYSNSFNTQYEMCDSCNECNHPYWKACRIDNSKYICIDMTSKDGWKAMNNEFLFGDK